MPKKNRQVRRPVKKHIKDCIFCKAHTAPDYKELDSLKRYINERGKIIGKSMTGLCQKHQKHLTVSIKRARYLALLPFIVRPS